MERRTVDFPVFDSDNHMYETQEAFTRYLPSEYRSPITYVQVNGRTKIAIKGKISEYIPNPTFEVVAPPGAQEDFYRRGNPEGKSLREIFGTPIPCPDWPVPPKPGYLTWTNWVSTGRSCFPPWPASSRSECGTTLT